jgi:Domain of unknown function (DUF4386)
MSAPGIMKRFADASPRFKARMAGVSFFVTMLTAAFTELFVRMRGTLNFASDVAAGIVEVSGMVVVTLLLYVIFKPLSRGLSLLAACCNLAALACECLQLQLRGVAVGLVFHGFYWLLIGYLIFRSAFLPRILGVLMAFAGLGWLTFLAPPLANYLSPYILVLGFLAELALMLWLLVMGVNVQRWKEQASSMKVTVYLRSGTAGSLSGNPT